jgi:hypothetical protein
LNVTSGAVTLSNTNVTYCSLSVSAGATLFIGGAVTINVTGNVDIEGTVNGIGEGYGSAYATSLGPGEGGFGNNSGGGGGSHGGSGGTGGNGTSGPTAGGAGGPTYDNPADPVLMGSAGGPVSWGLFLAFPFRGGAAFILNAPSGTVTLNGLMDMSGQSAPLSGLGIDTNCGAGAGGTLSITAQTILFNGILNAIGGTGGQGGGGGGGGMILLCPTLQPLSGTGTYSVAGGEGGVASGTVAAGNPGSPGTYTACSPPAATQGNEAFFISKNLLQPAQGAVSIYVATSQYPGPLKLRIFNSAGEYIQTLEDRHLTAPFQNSYSWRGTNWKGDAVASGVYFFFLTEPTDIKKAKLLLVR